MIKRLLDLVVGVVATPFVVLWLAFLLACSVWGLLYAVVAGIGNEVLLQLGLAEKRWY